MRLRLPWMGRVFARESATSDALALAAEASPATTPASAESASHPAEAPDTPEETTRRAFQSYLAGAIASFTGVVVGLPVVGYLAAPLVQRVRAAWISLGRADSFVAGDPKLVAVSIDRQDGWRRSNEARTAWVRVLGAAKFVVFNGQCTHLGCAYSWRTQGEHAGKFFCPCHDGVYDADGRVLDGPPPRRLDELETRVENGELFVLYQDYQQGIGEKKPL